MYQDEAEAELYKIREQRLDATEEEKKAREAAKRIAKRRIFAERSIAQRTAGKAESNLQMVGSMKGKNHLLVPSHVRTVFRQER